MTGSFHSFFDFRGRERGGGGGGVEIGGGKIENLMGGAGCRKFYLIC